MRRILFITHQTSRSGAPLLLLWLIKWMQENHDIRAYILCPEKKGIFDEFEKIGAIVHLLPIDLIPAKWPSRISKSIKKMLFLEKRLNGSTHAFVHIGKGDKISILPPDTWDLVYANTLVLGDILFKARNLLACPVITNAHELDLILSRSNTRVDFQLSISSALIVPSEAVEKCLRKHYSTSVRSPIYIVREWIPFPSTFYDEVVKERLQDILPSGYSGSERIVVGAGTLQDSRKGFDIFIQLIKYLVDEFNDLSIHGLWVGGDLSDPFSQMIIGDIEKLGIKGKVAVIPHVENPLSYIKSGDVFALTSREDPYPLVCLEAAAMHVPVVCFESAGGIPEFIRGGHGMSVPYLDIPSMAKAIASILGNPELTALMVQNAYRKVFETSSIDIAGNDIAAIIEDVLSSQSGPSTACDG